MSVIAERFTKTLKSIIYKTMTANDSKSYLPYLNKLVDQYSSTYHHSIGNKLLMLITLLWLKKLKRTVKFLNLKSVGES